MAMTEAELVAVVEAEMERAMGHPEGEIAAERAKAWRYFYQEPFGNEVEGSSQFVTSDVADVVEDVLPSLLRIFTTSDNLVEFEPEGPEDTPVAQQESDYVGWVFFTQNPSFEILYSWCFDALHQINGYVKAFWDDRELTTVENYEGLTDDQLDALLADDELELVEQDTRKAEAPATVRNAQGEAVQILADQDLHDVTFRRTRREGQVVVENVPPEEMRISPDVRGLDLGTARMVGQERDATRSELVEMGLSPERVAKLPRSGREAESPEEQARETRAEEDDDEGALDRSQEPVRVREVFQRVDFDGDGKAELRRVFLAGGELFDNDEVDRQPFHALSPQPIPHKHVGRSWSQKAFDIQDLNSTLTRQILDNLYHSNTPASAVWEQAIGENTLDDLLTTRAGAIKRFKRPVSESWQPIQVPFTAGATFPMLEQVEKTKQHRAGISPEAGGLTADALKNIQQSVMAQALDLKRMKIELVARIFAETGIRSLFLHIHELTLKHQRAKRVAQLRNKWVTVDPREWRTRRNMRVKIGLGLGTREQNLLHLEAIYQKQKDVVLNGGAGTLVTPQDLFQTFAALVRNANLMDPETFFTDPGDAQFPAAGQEGEQAAQLRNQVAQLEAQLRTREQDLDRERNLLQHEREMAKIELSRQKQESDLAIELEKIRNTLTKLELESGRDVPGSRV